MPPNVCIAYYSRTGNTRQVADAVASHCVSPTVHRIRPVVERTYPNWLLRSFVPGSTVCIEPVEADLRQYDAVFLGAPKWTLSCPPFTAYLRQVSLAGTPTGLFLTYGGFDEERYLRSMVDIVRRQGGDVRATLRVQREATATLDCEGSVATFCRHVLPTTTGH